MMVEIMKPEDLLKEASDAMELVYEDVLEVFNNPNVFQLGISEDVIRALMLSAFDLRNGINMCFGAGGWKTYGLASKQRERSDRHCGESDRSCGCDCSDCSQRGECLGGDLCCKKDC